MYMKDDKKVQSKIKLSGILRGSFKEKKSNFWCLIYLIFYFVF